MNRFMDKLIELFAETGFFISLMFTLFLIWVCYMFNAEYKTNIKMAELGYVQSQAYPNATKLWIKETK